MVRQQKRVDAARAIMEVVCEHGFGDKFVEIFEQHETALALEPRVSVAWPKVIVFQRAKFATQKTDDPEKWYANVTQSALRQQPP